MTEKAKERVHEAMVALNQHMLMNMAPIESLHLWYGCPLARWDHFNEERVFAHTNHIPGTVCVCEEISLLSDPYLYGILTHEFGHVLAIECHDDHTEDGADEAARSYLGLPICYGTALNVQYLPPSQMSQVKPPALLYGMGEPFGKELPKQFVRLIHRFMFGTVRGCLNAGHRILEEKGFYDLRWMCKHILGQAIDWILNLYPDMRLFYGGDEEKPENFLVFSDGEDLQGQIDLSPYAYDLDDPESYKRGHVRIDALDPEVFVNFLTTDPTSFEKETVDG